MNESCWISSYTYSGIVCSEAAQFGIFRVQRKKRTFSVERGGGAQASPEELFSTKLRRRSSEASHSSLNLE